MISKTAAKRQAHQESSMYRQGGGWIVSTWSDSYRLNILSNKLPHGVAARQLADWRIERAAHLRGQVEA